MPTALISSGTEETAGPRRSIRIKSLPQINYSQLIPVNFVLTPSLEAVKYLINIFDF